MLMSISIVHSFLLLVIFSCTTICLLIHLLMDIYIAAWILIQPICFIHGDRGQRGGSLQRGDLVRSTVHMENGEKAGCYPGKLCQQA